MNLQPLHTVPYFDEYLGCNGHRTVFVDLDTGKIRGAATLRFTKPDMTTKIGEFDKETGDFSEQSTAYLDYQQAINELKAHLNGEAPTEEEEKTYNVAANSVWGVLEQLRLQVQARAFRGELNKQLANSLYLKLSEVQANLYE